MNNIAVFDIETIRRPYPESHRAALKAGTLKVDYVTKDTTKVIEKYKEKWCFQAEGACPVAISFTIVDVSKRGIKVTESLSSTVETKLADFVFDTLDKHLPKKLVGFNSKRFDFPILEYLVRNSPRSLMKPFGKWDHIDISEYVPQFFTTFRPLKGSPVSVSELFGLPPRDNKYTGADVAELWAADIKNGTNEVEKYCREDTEDLANIFLKMSKLRCFSI